MPQSNISAWLQFAVQQMAAESYLDAGRKTGTFCIIERLEELGVV